MFSIKRLLLIDSDTFETTRNDFNDNSTNMNLLSAPLELCVWDDLCIYGNQLIEALNEIRHLISINYVSFFFKLLI